MEKAGILGSYDADPEGMDRPIEDALQGIVQQEIDIATSTRLGIDRHIGQGSF
jgi:hypothetical protein